MTVLPCCSCGVETLFETPPCADGHEDCPERVCTGCGAAVLLGPPPALPRRQPVPARAA